jgi:hypothetical protein
VPAGARAARQLLRGPAPPPVRHREIPRGVRQPARAAQRQLVRGDRQRGGRAPEGPGLPLRLQQGRRRAGVGDLAGERARRRVGSASHRGRQARPRLLARRPDREGRQGGLPADHRRASGADDRPHCRAATAASARRRAEEVARRGPLRIRDALPARLRLQVAVEGSRQVRRRGRSSTGSSAQGVEFAIANPLGVVPVVPVLNNPSMLRGGRATCARRSRCRTRSTSSSAT